MKTVYTFQIPGHFPVQLSQSESKFDAFTVTYGADIRDDKCYASAAKHLGECIMHALSCASIIDNRTLDEARAAKDKTPYFGASAVPTIKEQLDKAMGTNDHDTLQFANKWASLLIVRNDDTSRPFLVEGDWLKEEGRTDYVFHDLESAFAYVMRCLARYEDGRVD